MSKDYYEIDPRLLDKDLLITFNKSGYGMENWDLRKRIDKAIEYIENECLDENKLYCHDLVGNDIYEVLNILKGSDSNE